MSTASRSAAFIIGYALGLAVTYPLLALYLAGLP